MKKTELFFPFEPVAKGRPRFTRSGHAYTPNKTEEFEKNIADFYMKYSGFKYNYPVQVKLIFQMPIPKSFPKWKVEGIREGVVKHEKKPDLDNMAKAVLDALNGLAYEDDSKITRLVLAKHYSFTPGIRLEITDDVY